MAAPTSSVDWATDGGAEVSEPSAPQKATGFVHAEKPPAHWINWILKNLDEWIKWIMELIGLSHDVLTGEHLTDGTTIENYTDTGKEKLRVAATAAGDGLIGGGASGALDVNPDDIGIEINGSSEVALKERVAVVYSDNDGDSVGSGSTVLDFDDQEVEKGSGYTIDNTGDWGFTANRDMEVRVSVNCTLVATNAADLEANDNLELWVLIDGVQHRMLDHYVFQNSAGGSGSRKIPFGRGASTIVEMSSGEKLSLAISYTYTGTPTVTCDTSAGRVWVAIEEV